MVDKRKAQRDALARAMNEFSSKPTSNRFLDALTRATEARPPDPYNPNNVPEDHPNNDPENFRLGPGLGRTTLSNLQRLQAELNKERYGGQEAPPIRMVPKELRWQDFTYGQLRPDMTDDAERLQYWGAQWMTPTGSNGYGSNVTAYRIFFAILAENGLSREDFNWNRFRNKYFSLDRSQGGNQRALFLDNQKLRRKTRKDKK